MNETVQTLSDALMHRVFIELEASGRHVHLTKHDAMVLFGHSLTPKRPLSQPGQFLSQERLCVIGPKGRFERVAVLGPERPESQVELSMTDAHALGITAPVRLSGSIADTPPVLLQTELGQVQLERGVIIAQRHIHMTPEDAQLRGISDRQVVRLRCLTARPLTFEDVVVRVSRNFATYAHLDFDEANACGLRPGDLAIVVP